MEDFTEGEEFKSDVYSKSINQLVTTYNPKTVDELSELLDDNGYYGRFEIVRVATKFYREVCVKVNVYLPDSIHTYEWPYMSHYNLTLRKFSKRPKPRMFKEDFRLMKCLYFFLLYKWPIDSSFEHIANLGFKCMGWATQSDYLSLTVILHKIGFFNRGEFVIKSEEDLIEVKENLFSYSYFM